MLRKCENLCYQVPRCGADVVLKEVAGGEWAHLRFGMGILRAPMSTVIWFNCLYDRPQILLAAGYVYGKNLTFKADDVDGFLRLC